MIGIIFAMEPEGRKLIGMLEDTREEQALGLTFYLGKLSGKDVVLVRSGMGKVNAGISCALLLARYPIEAVINTGIAGSLNASIDIGDIVLSKTVVHHDVDATFFGYKLGEVPQVGTCEFPGDEKLLQTAFIVNQETNPDNHVFIGKVCSGDQFIDSTKAKERIHQSFGGDCCEMEGASIAQVAWTNHIPFLIIREISDKADDSAKMDYPEFEEMAVNHCVRLTSALLARL